MFGSCAKVEEGRGAPQKREAAGGGIITARTVFPDLDGLAEGLCQEITLHAPSAQQNGLAVQSRKRKAQNQNPDNRQKSQNENDITNNQPGFGESAALQRRVRG